jgi:hypothetical protein
MKYAFLSNGSSFEVKLRFVWCVFKKKKKQTCNNNIMCVPVLLVYNDTRVVQNTVNDLMCPFIEGHFG